MNKKRWRVVERGLIEEAATWDVQRKSWLGFWYEVRMCLKTENEATTEMNKRIFYENLHGQHDVRKMG